MRLPLAVVPTRILQQYIRWSIPATTSCSRAFHASPLTRDKPLPPRPVIPEADIDEKFLHGSGPGGQKINKTSSAVQLKHLPSGVVVKCQETRSRTQNRKIARRLLSERLEEIWAMEKGEKGRYELKAEVIRKRKASAKKKSRRKYRAAEEGKHGVAPRQSDEEVHDDGDDGLPLIEDEAVGSYNRDGDTEDTNGPVSEHSGESNGLGGQHKGG